MRAASTVTGTAAVASTVSTGGLEQLAATAAATSATATVTRLFVIGLCPLVPVVPHCPIAPLPISSSDERRANRALEIRQRELIVEAGLEAVPPDFAHLLQRLQQFREAAL